MAAINRANRGTAGSVCAANPTNADARLAYICLAGGGRTISGRRLARATAGTRISASAEASTATNSRLNPLDLNLAAIKTNLGCPVRTGELGGEPA